MAAGLTAETFARLLECLDRDRQRAGEKYEDLRRTLVRFFEWRSAPSPEEQTDETLDRVARRLSEGVEVHNVGAYSYRVAQLVLLEHLKGRDRRRSVLDPAMLASVRETGEAALAREARLVCLDRCVAALPVDGRRLIVEYYSDREGGRIDVRKRLAERLGIRAEALANRAQRLRDKLQRCVAACLRHDHSSSATEQ